MQFNKNLRISDIFYEAYFSILLFLKKDLGTVFGEVVRRHRNERGLSQMALAAESGLHLTAVGSVERGRWNPSLHTVFVIARALNCHPQDLVAETFAEDPNLWKNAESKPKGQPGRPRKTNQSELGSNTDRTGEQTGSKNS